MTSTVIRSIGNSWAGERQLDWTGGSSNIRYYGTNAHHDTVWTGSSTGTVSATLRYDPWGTLTGSSGSSLPDFRFQSSWFDTTTSLQWVVARWYAPALGRFLSEDSLLGEPNDPPSQHLFAYSTGNPIGGWDPDGRCSMDVAQPSIFELGLRGATCVLEGAAATAVGTATAVPAVLVFAASLPFVIAGDTVRPTPPTQTKVRRIARLLPFLTPKGCFVIGEYQKRVDDFAARYHCATMVKLTGKLLTLPRAGKMFLNGLWMETQMLQAKILYDIGPMNPPMIISPYYQMERIYAAVYPFTVRLWGWGLPSGPRIS